MLENIRTLLREGFTNILFCTKPVPSDFVVGLVFCASVPSDLVNGKLRGLQVTRVCQEGPVFFSFPLHNQLGMTHGAM